ncbi:MAG: lysostaphin resistance A-like protein [Fimbriimonadales bacterium]
MRDSARYAWWLLVFLFTLIIVGNVALFWMLFRQPEGRGLASGNEPLGVEFQIRYALALERLGLGDLATQQVLTEASKSLDTAYAPYEAAVYRVIIHSALEQGKVEETLRTLPDLPSEILTPPARRWQAMRLREALTEPLSAKQVPPVLEGIGTLPSPLARTLLEMALYARAGDTARADALRQSVVQQAVRGVLTLGAVLLVMGVAGMAGFGVLLWYLITRPALPTRPAPDEPPDAYDPLLWALVIFLLVMLNAPTLQQILRDFRVDGSNAIYLLAVLLPLIYLVSLRGQADAVGRIEWFRGGFWRQMGAAFAGYAAYVPILSVLLIITMRIAPALPAEQTNPIGERAVEMQSVLSWLWLFLQAAVLAPIIEEIVFRGVLFKVLWQRTGRVWLSAFVSGYLFAVIHPQFLGGILPITVLGTILALVYAHTRSLLPCMVIHALNNGLITLLMWGVLG